MKACIGLFMAVTLSACSGSVTIEVPTQFPVPLVQPLPLTMGVHLDKTLTEYVHKETIEARGNWRIVLGPAQKPMFDSLLHGLFTGVEFIDDPLVPTEGIAGVLQPSIEELQFSTPQQTHTEYFEVWIRYKFILYDNNGAALGDWELTAYGKANEGNYGIKSKEPALQAAAFAACRDAMAFFTLEFQKEPTVVNWLRTALQEVRT
ncbi:MAG: hypothetical protein O7F71_21185 [Gammaproteobacteria bacterium]|nr:hypothetical protein [Gammaproteobacteria bacterium]